MKSLSKMSIKELNEFINNLPLYSKINIKYKNGYSYYIEKFEEVCNAVYTRTYWYHDFYSNYKNFLYRTESNNISIEYYLNKFDDYLDIMIRDDYNNVIANDRIYINNK